MPHQVSLSCTLSRLPSHHFVLLKVNIKVPKFMSYKSKKPFKPVADGIAHEGHNIPCVELYVEDGICLFVVPFNMGYPWHSSPYRDLTEQSLNSVAKTPASQVQLDKHVHLYTQQDHIHVKQHGTES